MQVERHWEQGCANEAHVRQVLGGNQTGEKHRRLQGARHKPLIDWPKDYNY